MNAVRCPGCEHEIRYGDEHAGRRGKCRKCGSVVQLPPRAAEEVLSPEAARGKALALILNRMGEQAAADHPDDDEAAGDEMAERFALIAAGSVCQGCHAVAPTRQASFNYHVGAILLF